MARPSPEPELLASGPPFGHIEAFKHVWEVFGRNSGTIIGNAHVDMARVFSTPSMAMCPDA
jgi:hypothetical protein